jgi:hypothetical protein
LNENVAVASWPGPVRESCFTLYRFWNLSAPIALQISGSLCVSYLSPPDSTVNFKNVIDRYTIEFSPAVSQKKLQQRLQDGKSLTNSDVP